MRCALVIAGAAALLAASLASASPTVTASPTSASVTVTLTGDDQVATFSEALAVSGEASGSWNLTAYAALPTVGTATLNPLSVTALPTAACGPGNCTASTPSAGTTSTAWPVALGLTAGTATKFWVSTAGSTNKTQTITVVFGVPVLGKDVQGVYSTTLNVSVADGP